MKKWGMERIIVIVRLCVCFFVLSLVVGGCTPKTKPASSSSPPPPPEARRLPQQRVWEGERAKVVVMEFDNRVRLQPRGKSQVVPDVFGKSMQRYLVKGLHQTEQFAVLKNSRTTRVLKESDFTPVGQMRRKTMEQIGPFEGAEFLITGSVIAYQLSKESVTAGVEDDPFFSEPVVAGGGSPTESLVKKMFVNLLTVKQDRIAIGLSVIDVTTGKIIDSTIVEGTAQEFGAQKGRFFEEQLLRTSGSLRTPMQKALRACTMKAVDWIADTGLTYRRQAALRSVSPAPPVVEKSIAVKKPGAEKKSDKEPIPSSRPTQKPDLVERSIGEKPEAEKPMVEKTIPKKEAPQSEEWGQ
jgi:curli biogenesis system outer membrane secretion channel CsgG